MKEPLSMILKALSGTLRSSAFLGVFVVIYHCGSSFTGPRLILNDMHSLLLRKEQPLRIPHLSCIPIKILRFQSTSLHDNTAGPRGPHLETVFLARRPSFGSGAVRGREKEKGGVGDVCASERIGKCVGDVEGERVDQGDGRGRGESGMCAGLESVQVMADLGSRRQLCAIGMGMVMVRTRTAWY